MMFAPESSIRASSGSTDRTDPTARFNFLSFLLEAPRREKTPPCREVPNMILSSIEQNVQLAVPNTPNEMYY
jgi:hypothetical protein